MPKYEWPNNPCFYKLRAEPNDREFRVFDPKTGETVSVPKSAAVWFAGLCYLWSTVLNGLSIFPPTPKATSQPHELLDACKVKGIDPLALAKVIKGS